ncbi:hypothetical protein [Croceiramulus getboli]|nr:hypothetical protein P8624_06210 [Flavobacteriaceae bacterium YJPT1-3]
MKRLIIATLTLGTFFASTPTLTAQEEIAEAQVELQAPAVSDFVKIDIADLPEAVTAAVAADFAESEIKEAYVNEKANYKLVLTKADEDDQTVYATKEGEWIDEADASPEQ